MIWSCRASNRRKLSDEGEFEKVMAIVGSSSMNSNQIDNTRSQHSFILILSGLSICHDIEDILIPRLVDETTQFTIRELQ